MLKYILFKIDSYYPSGGLYDKFGSFDSLLEIEEYLNQKKRDGDFRQFSEFIIADRDTWQNIGKYLYDEERIELFDPTEYVNK